jgi:hypothetical protein
MESIFANSFDEIVSTKIEKYESWLTNAFRLLLQLGEAVAAIIYVYTTDPHEITQVLTVIGLVSIAVSRTIALIVERVKHKIHRVPEPRNLITTEPLGKKWKIKLCQGLYALNLVDTATDTYLAICCTIRPFVTKDSWLEIDVPPDYSLGCCPISCCLSCPTYPVDPPPKITRPVTWHHAPFDDQKDLVHVVTLGQDYEMKG